MTEFTGRTALITGGTSGMGLATARRMLERGAQVVITGRDDERLERAVSALDGGERVLGVRADVADLTALDDLANRIAGRYGSLDVVFANAGTLAVGDSTELTEADVDRVVGVNFKGVLFTIQKTLPLFGAGGAIVINGSWTMHRGNATIALYSASKAAAQNLARTLAAELAGRRIRVNSVSPGYIDTAMFPEAALDPAEAARLRDRVPLRRFGRAEEVAAAVTFLASDDASYITGQDLVVDGGLLGAFPAHP